MIYNKFISKLNEDMGLEVIKTSRSYGNVIQEMEDGIYINGNKTELVSLEEARQYVKQTLVTENISDELTDVLYEDINNNKIASIITEHHNVKVTDTIIETYKDLASSKLFTLDPVVEEIRGLNALDNTINGKIDFILDDGSKIAISESTFDLINNILNQNDDVVKYMRESKENFINVIEQLEV